MNLSGNQWLSLPWAAVQLSIALYCLGCTAALAKEAGPPAPPADPEPGPVSKASPKTGEPYRDRLIDPDVKPDPPADELRTTDGELPWVAGAAYRLGFRDEEDSNLTEHALEGHYQRDTANWGRLQLDVLARNSNADTTSFFDGRDGSDGQLTLTQTGFPVASGWLADSGLGVQRSASDPLIESSYRLYLPSSIVNGVTTRVGDDRHEFRFTWGEVGRVEGLYSRVFESDDAQLTGGGYSHDFGNGWRAAAEIWQSDPDDGTDGTGALAGAVGYGTPGEDRSDEVHFLSDDDGDSGAWYDGYRATGRWAHRFGAMSLDPGLEWQNAAILDDRDGAYYRLDYQKLSAAYNAGLDVSRVPSMDRMDYRAYGGARWRLGLDRSLGAQASLGSLEPPSVEAVPDTERERETRRDWRLSAYYTETYDDWFDNRIEIATTGFEGLEDEKSYELTLDQYWLRQPLDGLTTRLELERRERGDADLDQARAGMTYRRQLPGGLSVDAGVLLVRQEQEGGGDATGGNLNLNLNWPFHDNWTLSVNAIHNRNVRSDPLLPDQTEAVKGNQLFVSLSYGRSGGRLPGVQGAGSAERGIGRVSGYVYFDENGDGRKSPGESGVEGVVVRLDGVVTTITNAQGRFEYWPVAAGNHRVRVSVESVPLPWEPAGTITVTVQPRGESFHDLPLRRIDE